MKRLRQSTLMNWLLLWDNEEITTSRLLQLINEYFKAEKKMIKNTTKKPLSFLNEGAKNIDFRINKNNGNIFACQSSRKRRRFKNERA